MKKILVLDNYDSFTYNLVHIIKELGYEVDVIRNDKISIAEVDQYDKILLSPGPGIPEEAGIMHEVIRTYGPTKSILGVCLGHQGIGEVYGSKLTNMETVLHGFGMQTTIVDKNCRMFKGLPETFITGRYHSWVVDENALSDQLILTAVGEDGRIMGLRHKEYDVIGVQFHPESILTENGIQMMKNWLES
jgi:anthranilate synthase component II